MHSAPRQLVWLTAKPVPACSVCGLPEALSTSGQAHALPTGQQPHSPALEVPLELPGAVVEDAAVACTLRGASCTATNTGRTPEAHTSVAPVGRQRIGVEHLPQLMWRPGHLAAQVRRGAGLACPGDSSRRPCTAQHVWHTRCPYLWLLNNQANARRQSAVCRLRRLSCTPHAACCCQCLLHTSICHTPRKFLHSTAPLTQRSVPANAATI